jgi:RND family efflux transporter MFP subunit
MSPRRSLSVFVLLLTAFGAGAGAVWWWMRSATPPAERAASTGAAANEAKEGAWFTCGMHPEVVQDHPGNCPKCGMKLQPMSRDRAVAMVLAKPDEAEKPGEKGKIRYWKSSMIPGEIHQEPGKDSMGMDLVPVYEGEDASAGAIRIDPVTEQNMGVRIDEVVVGPLVKTLRTVGIVAYDETTLAVVNTKVDGWVEKLYVDETGVQLHQGDPLFELYSPALFSAQEGYLAALRNLQQKDIPSIPRAHADSEGLLRDARTRLEYFDISPAQIDRLERTRKVEKTLTLYAPFTGIVTHKNVVDGQRIMAGMELFRIADLSTVWVIGKVYEQDVPYIRLGQEAYMTLTYLPGKTFRGRVTYVYPYLEEKAREVPVRMEFHNPGYELKPGMYATITLTSELAKEATLVPDVAVIRTGLRSVAFVMTGPGRYEGREVQVGVRSENNHLQILSGLAPGEKVVVSGQFLLDSESRLREAALKFLEPGKVNAATPLKEAAERAEQAAGAPLAPGAGDLFYACPMPEHVDILYAKPGRCPLCGMQLVPVRRNEGHVEGPSVAYWTCPMPEHARVHEKGPGKCPICGMSLIPVTKGAEEEPAATPTAPAEGGHAH